TALDRTARGTQFARGSRRLVDALWQTKSGEEDRSCSGEASGSLFAVHRSGRVTSASLSSIGRQLHSAATESIGDARGGGGGGGGSAMSMAQCLASSASKTRRSQHPFNSDRQPF